MRKILVVDDDIDLLGVMETLFQVKGFKVDTTPKGEEAFEKVEAFQPEIILMDVVLGSVDGRKICKQLKGRSDTRHIPIVLFSSDASVKETIHEYDANDFIAKPFDVIALISKVTSLLKHCN